MEIMNNFYAFKDATTPAESEPTINIKGESVTVQVDGTGTGISLQLVGCADLKSNEYYVITGFDSGFKTIDTITTNGLYTFPVDGLGRFKLNLSAINEGSVTVFCRMMGV